MYSMGAALGGVGGGVLGALIWAGVAYAFQLEIGWIAWAIGGLVGFGVTLGNRGPGGTATGVLAVGISVMSILAGKYWAVQIAMPDADTIVEAYAEQLDNEEFVVSYVADAVAEEFELEGKAVDWPAGVDPEQASTRAEYPPDVWTEALTRWSTLSDDGKTQFRNDREQEMRANVAAAMPELRATAAEEGFLGSFGPLDILFFGLAVVTAFKIAASGGAPEEDEQPSAPAS